MDELRVRRGWPAGSGEMAALVRAHDWSKSPLGPPENWQPSLRATVELMLGAQAQIVLFWGPEFVALYNDAYAPTIGDKHPHALGRPARENWAELWSDLEPLLQGVLETGETFAAKDRPFYIERHGFGETVYFDVSYSAVREPDGSVGGVLCIVTETTWRVLAERDLRAREARQAFLLGLSDALWPLADPVHIQNEATRLLGEHLEVDRCYYVEADPAGDWVIRRDHRRTGQASVAGRYAPEDWPQIGEALARGAPIVVADIATTAVASNDERSAIERLGIRAMIVIPIVKRGAFASGMVATQARPRNWTGGEVALVGEVAERTWAAVEHGRAETALRDSEERLQVLVDELQHRTRNLMTVVRSVAEKSRRESRSPDGYTEVLLERLNALSRAQGLLSRRTGITKVTFDELLRAELAAHTPLDVAQSRVRLDGPDGIRLASKSVQILALAIHELTTNAVKYGALAQPQGELSVRWRIEAEAANGPSRLFIDWRESGVVVPDADAPEQGGGYGRELIERALPFQLKAKTTYRLGAKGVRCTIALPIAGDRTEEMDHG